MGVKNTVLAIPLTAFDTSALTTDYAVVTTLPQAVFSLRLNNICNKNLVISYDGVTDHEYLVADESTSIDSQTNSQPNNYVALFAKGTQIWAKLPVAGGATGLLLVSGYYQPLGV